MRKYFLLFFIFISFHGFTQWTQLNLNTTSRLSSIKVISNSIYVGGSDSLFISRNSGNTWTSKKVVDQAGVTLMMNTFSGLHVLDSNTFVGAGVMFAGNSSAVIKSVNEGNNWTVVNVTNSGNYPRQMNDLSFPSPLVGYAVGTNGRILKTNNGGNTWSTQSATIPVEVVNVHAVSTTNVYASGSGYFFKTINGGANWNYYSIGSGAKYLSMLSNGIGFAVSQTTVYKSMNDGNTWTDIYSNFNSITAILALNEDTVLIGADDELYISRDGGILWEKFPNLTGNTINKIYFLDNNNGYFVTEEGKVFRTSNLGGSTMPISLFTTLNTIYCIDEQINFINQGPSTYTYQWFLNGNYISDSVDYSYVPVIGGIIDTISLVTYNGNFYDTCTRIIYVQPSYVVDEFIAVADPDTICPIHSSIITVFYSQPGTYYKLYNGTNQIGAFRIGNGDTLCFNTGNINYTTSFTVTASRSNPCGSQQISHNAIVRIVVINYSLPISAINNIVCYGDSTIIKVANSQLGVDYQLKDNNGVFIGLPQHGTGDTLYFQTTKILSNKVFKIFATTQLGCSSAIQMSTTVNVTVRDLNMDFSSVEGVFVNDSIYFTNLSMADSYIWEFDFSSSVQSSSTTDAVTTFSSSGEKQVTLIGNTIQGCIDTIVKAINVFKQIPDTGGVICSNSYTNLTMENCAINAMYADEEQNLYVAKLVHIGVGGCYQESGYVDNFKVEKYDKNGNFKWEQYLTLGYGCRYSYLTGMVTDDQNNVYIVGKYYAYGFSISGINLATNSYLGDHAFIVKLDSLGNALWAMYTDNSSGPLHMGFSDIQYYNHKLYVSGVLNSGQLKMANGQNYSIPSINNYTYLFVINENGIVEKCLTTTNAVVSNIRAGNCSSCLSYVYSGALFATFPKLKIINPNEFILYNQNYVCRTDSLLNVQSNFSTFFNTNYINPYFPSVAFDDDNNIYFSTSWDYTHDLNLYPPYGSINGNPVNAIKGNLISKYDLNGNLLWYNLSPHYISASLVFSSSSNILLYGYYFSYLSMEDQSGDYFGLTGFSTPSFGAGRGFLASITKSGTINSIKNLGLITKATGRNNSRLTDGNMAAVSDNCGNTFLIARSDSAISFNGQSILTPTGSHFIIEYSENNLCEDSCQQLTYIVENYDYLNVLISVFPNPVNNELIIQTNTLNKRIMIEIFNSVGKLMFKGDFIKDQIIINTKEYSEGVYIINISDGNMLFSKKVIKL